MNMKSSLAFSLILCCLCRVQTLSGGDDIQLMVSRMVESEEEKAQTPEPRTEAETGEQGQVFHSDIWAELRALRDMVVEQRVELNHLTARVTAAESLVEGLQMDNDAMVARLTAAESLAEELQMENDAQAAELALAQQKLSSLQERMTVSENHVEELEKQQEGQKATVQELQNANTVRKLAFSASVRTSGEGNTDRSDSPVHLIYRNVITNIGNHYNPHTGYFTAPVRGVYFFRVTGHVAHSVDASMRLDLIKNGHIIVTAGDRSTTGTDPEDNASNGVVLQLEVGDVVSVQLYGRVWDDQYRRTTFSGFLLFNS